MPTTDKYQHLVQPDYVPTKKQIFDKIFNPKVQPSQSVINGQDWARYFDSTVDIPPPTTNVTVQEWAKYLEIMQRAHQQKESYG